MGTIGLQGIWIWVDRMEDNYKRLMQTFLKFGLPTTEISLNDFLNDSDFDVFTFGKPPVSIDIMTKVKGLVFKEAYKSMRLDKTQGFDIKMIGYEDLLIAKTASHRLQDQLDLAKLQEE